MAANTIYKLLTRGEWAAAQAEGVYHGSAHDKRDGFIHFSTAAQLPETAWKHFSGVAELVLLAVEIGALGQISPHPGLLSPGEGGTTPLLSGELQENGAIPLRWEPSRGGDLFPHLYAELPISAVESVSAVPLGEDGVPIIPGNLTP